MDACTILLEPISYFCCGLFQYCKLMVVHILYMQVSDGRYTIYKTISHFFVCFIWWGEVL